MRDAEALASGIGRSFRDVNRDDVSGKAEAYERTIDARFWVLKLVGIVCGGMDWKRSGNLASMFGRTD